MRCRRSFVIVIIATGQNIEDQSDEAGTPRRRGFGDGRRVPESRRSVTSGLYIRAIQGYQRFGSPVLSTFVHCRYRPTGSAYSIEAVRIHGIRAVLVLAVKRIASCMPSVPPGTADPVPLALR